MASAPPPTDLQHEAKCPICLGCLTDPVVLDCGYSFCRSCITSYYEMWEALGEVPECPMCKAKIQKQKFRPNWHLANVVEKLKQMALSVEKEDLCWRHKEKLHLFCKEDEMLVCLVCEKSPEHKGHTMLIVEQAVQLYKDQIYNCLETVRRERERVLADKATAKTETQDLLKSTKSERKKTVTKLKQLSELLEEGEKVLLAQMEAVEKDIARKRDEHLARLSQDLSSLESLIREMEEKIQQPPSEFLQDIRSTLQRYEEKKQVKRPAAFPSELRWRLWDVCDISSFLQGVMNEFEDGLLSGLEQQKAHVTLDPETANPYLVLSEDLKSVRLGSKRNLPNNAERFDSRFIVLGREGFTAGRHFWDVLVENKESWAVGVARKSMKRKGLVTMSPEEGTWGVERWESGYRALTRPPFSPLCLSGELRIVRVCLNYSGGQVAFFDAHRNTLLYQFSKALFSGETLQPFFYVSGKASLTLSP
ncbi:tripartite motif-containing protein 10-like [Paroedura picta]|uniref:tripartite motif-containing protein 10-like n=1 Tax=Paroedura picta TaxID=143630 RepID=UPI00405625B2